MKKKTLLRSIFVLCLISVSAFTLVGCVGHKHELTKVEKVSPTCTTTGYDSYYACTCGSIFSDPEGLNELNQKPVLEKVDHTYSDTLSYDENNHYYSATCGCKDEFKDVTAHTFDKEVAESEYLNTTATCDKKATYFKSCVCGAKGTETFEHGEFDVHTYSTEYSKDENYHWFAANCAHTSEIKDKVAHVYDQSKVSSVYLEAEATCGSPATYFKSCVCGAKGTETFNSGTATGNHTFGDDYGHDETEHWKLASCGCEVTGEKTAHDTSTGICVCGYFVDGYYTPGLTFSAQYKPPYYTEEVDYYIAQADDLEEKVVVIPATYNGAPVNSVNIAHNEHVETLYLPATFTGLHGTNFMYCTSIKKVVFEEGSPYRIIDGNIYIVDENDVPSTLVMHFNKEQEEFTIPDFVKTLDYSCFSNNKTLKSVVIPSTVETANAYTFERSNIESVEINGITAIPHRMFNECSKLRNVTINSDITSIGIYAFAKTAIKEFVVPNGVSSLDATFYGSKLLTVTLGENITEISSDTFTDCKYLIEIINKSNYNIQSDTALVHKGPSIIEKVGDFYFASNGVDKFLVGYVGSDENLVLPDCDGENYSIYDYAFEGLDFIKTVYIPKNVTSIGDYAFAGIGEFWNNYEGMNIESVTFESDSALVNIGYRAFAYNDKLTSFTFPSNVESVGNYAFFRCGLESVSINEGLEEISESMFSWCTNLTSVTIPNSVLVIGDCAFSDCSKLTTVNFNQVLVEIGDSAFSSAGITSANLPETVESIGMYAFSYTKLTTFVFPSKVEVVSYQVLFGCTQLNSVTFGAGVRTIHSHAIKNCDNLSEIVFNCPKTNWTRYTSEYNMNNNSGATSVDSSNFANSYSIKAYLTDNNYWLKCSEE